MLMDPSGMSGQQDGLAWRSTGSSDELHSRMLASAPNSSTGLRVLMSEIGGSFLEFGVELIGALRWGIQGLGTLAQGIFGARDVVQANRIASDLNDPNFWVRELDNAYQKGGRRKSLLDDIAVGLGGKEAWSSLSQTEKVKLVSENLPDVQASLGGGFVSGAVLPKYGSERYR